MIYLMKYMPHQNNNSHNINKDNSSSSNNNKLNKNKVIKIKQKWLLNQLTMINTNKSKNLKTTAISLHLNPKSREKRNNLIFLQAN